MYRSRLILALSLGLALAACKTDRERAEEAFQRGMALLQAGDPARARVEFRNAIAADMTYLDAEIQMGRLNLREGKEKAAFRSYVRAHEIDPANLEAATTLARIAFVSREWDLFDRYAAEALKLAPRDGGVQAIDLARQYRQATLARDEAARGALLARAEPMTADRPDDLLLRFVLIDAYVNAGRYEDARAQVDAAVAADPDNVQLHPLRLQVLANLKDAAGIEAELRRMQGLFPTDAGYKGSLLRFLISTGQTDKAEAFLREQAARPADGDKAAEDAATAAVVDLVQFLKIQRGAQPALAELETRLASDPEAHPLRALRAALNHETGRRDAAIAEMEALTALPEGAITTQERQSFKVGLAGMLMQNGNEVGARRQIEEVLASDPNNVEALKIKAGWLIAEDKTAEAIGVLRTALAESPEDTAAMRLMADAYARAGNRDLMLESLSLAVEASKNAPEESLRYARALLRESRLDQAEATLVSALRVAPRNVALLQALGQVHLEENDLPQARQVLGRIEALKTDEARRAASELELRLIEREQGTEEALDYLGALAETNEDDRVKLALIRAQLLAGKTAEALDYATELVASKPGDFAYRYFLALARAANRDHAGAETILAELVRERPDQSQPWLQLARVRALAGAPEGMMGTLDEALKIRPDAPDLLWAKASILERKGEVEGAIAIYDRLDARDSSSVVVANNLASLLATHRDDPESLARAETIARRLRDADAPELKDTYGWILYRNGKPAEALPYLEAAAGGLPGDPLVQAHLGLVYNALGRKPEARAQLEQARAAAGETPGPALSDTITSLETALTQ